MKSRTIPTNFRFLMNQARLSMLFCGRSIPTPTQRNTIFRCAIGRIYRSLPDTRNVARLTEKRVSSERRDPIVPASAVGWSETDSCFDAGQTAYLDGPIDTKPGGLAALSQRNLALACLSSICLWLAIGLAPVCQGRSGCLQYFSHPLACFEHPLFWQLMSELHTSFKQSMSDGNPYRSTARSRNSAPTVLCVPSIVLLKPTVCMD